MATFLEILSVKQQMEIANAEDLQRLTHRLAELRGTHASAINADALIHIVSWLPPPNLAYPSNSSSPLNVSHVCRTWRHITLSSPSLWSRFSFYRDEDSELSSSGQTSFSMFDNLHPRFEAAIEAWDTWLIRSRSSPLNIEFDLDSMQWSLDDYERIIKLLTMTLSHQKRWKHVRVDFPHKAHDVALTMCDMPLLESLSVDVSAEHSKRVCGDLDVCLDLSCSPRLKKLQMVQISCFRDAAPALGNLRHLTMLAMDINLTWNDFTQIVRFAPQLQCIDRIVLPVNDVRDATEVVLPMVHEARFELAEMQSKTLYLALSQLVMPSLETFDITVYNDDTTADLGGVCTGIKSLLLRSKCPLTSLRLGFSDYGHFETPHDRSHILDLLCAIPTLRHLSLEKHDLDDVFLHALTVTSSSAGLEPQNNLCPALESIDFPSLQNNISSECFYQMVASRWRAGRTLRKVDICNIYLKSASRETCAMINTFISEGLEIQAP
ncbi:hypothetical protein DFH11DRAFT_703537 [Phellopilus nigrolimitatus]|nr:hypothetical protein DFH11DRAFT_703537 [Phellopilus nigrolimitatus]